MENAKQWEHNAPAALLANEMTVERQDEKLMPDEVSDYYLTNDLINVSLFQ